MKATDYKHAEAFCLMTYRSDDGTEEEVIWNSRDGVTPFVITLRSGKIASHQDWHSDRCVPDHKPVKGERIFIDMTEERAQEIGLRNCRMYWPNALGVVECTDGKLAAEARQQWSSPEEMAADIMDWREGMPDIREVAE